MKTVSRNKLLLCFRPVDVDAGNRSFGQALTYISAGNNHNDVNTACSREPAQKRTLSRAVRAALFQVISRKRGRNKKILRSSERSESMRSDESSSASSSSSSYTSDENRSYKTEELGNQETGPESAVSESRNRFKSLKHNRNRNAAAAKQGFNSGVFLFLISLVITVLLGKLWAILFTSIWLYFLPLPRDFSGDRRKESTARMGRSYYTKRVVKKLT